MRSAAPPGGVDSLLNGGSLLDANVNIHANADLTAPVDGAVAANANVAAPIDASVAANIGSDGAVAQSLADQQVDIHQHLDDVSANATAEQDATSTSSKPWSAGSDRMSATVDRPAASADVQAPPLARVEGLELLGEVSGSGYKEGAALVRRADGQMVQLGPLMYGLLEEIDGQRDNADALAAAHVRAARARLRGRARRRDRREARRAGPARRLGGERAAAKLNPLLALRWKVLFTDPKVTRRITAPFERPLPPVAAAAGCWWASPSSAGSC